MWAVGEAQINNAEIIWISVFYLASLVWLGWSKGGSDD
jgi:hypothetical protein